jgi:3-hydroxyisobutyrate dehydrogenase-like beta-hydroxyacid dehydrogenase
MNVAFIGLGVMGYPMAGHLAKAGHQVNVYNRTQSKAARWAEEYKGTYAETPAAAAAEADIVFVCVGNDDDLREVVCGESGVLKRLRRVLCLLITQPLQRMSPERSMPLPRRKTLAF